MRKKISGIYCIENLVNGKRYIGQTKDLHKRKISHFGLLRNGNHTCKNLQIDYNNSSLENFIFFILVECNKENLSENEKYYVNYYESNNPEFGYNSTSGGSTQTERTKEYLLKLSICKRGEKNPMFGKKLTEEQRKKLSISHIGIPHISPSENTKNKISKTLQGNRPKNKSPENKFIGVRKRKNRFEASITFKGKYYYLGLFKNEEDAAIAYNNKAIELYGDNAKLNILIGGD